MQFLGWKNGMFWDGGNFTPNSLPNLLWDIDSRAGVYTDGAVQFVQGAGERLTVNSNAGLQVDTNDWSLCGWFYLEDTSATHILCSKFASTGEWQLRNQAGGSMFMYLYPGAVTTNTPGGSVVINTWYFLNFTRSGTTTTLQLNRGTKYTNTFTGSVTPLASALVFGGSAGPGSSGAGRMDSWGFWNGRALSDAEFDQLYNAGGGMSYSDLTTGLKTGLTSWWDFDETTGTRNDSQGSNHLTEAFLSFINASTLNGGFETAGAGGADVFANWTEATAGTSTISRDTVVFDTGVASCLLTIDAGGSEASVAQTVLVSNKSYTYTIRAKAVAGTPTVRITLGGSAFVDRAITTSWATYTGTVTSGGTDFKLSSTTALAAINLDGVIVIATNIGGANGIDSALATDGDPVKQWTDFSLGFNAFQATYSAKPIYRANIFGTNPGIDFDGVSKWMDSSLFGFLYDTITMYVLCLHTTSHTGYVVSVGDPGGSLLQYNATNMYVGVQPQPVAPHGRSIGQAGIFTVQGNSLWVNNVLATPGATTSLAPGNLSNQLGCSDDGTISLFNGKIGAILIYNATHTAAQRKTVNQYLNAQFGLGFVI